MKAKTISMSEHTSDEKPALVQRFRIILQQTAARKYSDKSVQGSKNTQAKVQITKRTAVRYTKDYRHQKKR